MASVYIQETKVENFSLVSLREQIIGEWEHSNAGKGGVDLIHFLLAKAVSPTDAAEILPSPNSVREWQFCDILKFPKEIQEEWKAACHEELEVLHR